MYVGMRNTCRKMKGVNLIREYICICIFTQKFYCFTTQLYVKVSRASGDRTMTSSTSLSILGVSRCYIQRRSDHETKGLNKNTKSCHLIVSILF